MTMSPVGRHTRFVILFSTCVHIRNMKMGGGICSEWPRTVPGVVRVNAMRRSERLICIQWYCTMEVPGRLRVTQLAASRASLVFQKHQNARPSPPVAQSSARNPVGGISLVLKVLQGRWKPCRPSFPSVCLIDKGNRHTLTHRQMRA